MKPIERLFPIRIFARLATVVFFLVAGSAARLDAQGYGSIVGTVTDPTGATIAAPASW